VLTGHSLGGAVAVLTTVRLLRSLTAEQHQGLCSLAPQQEVLPRVRCISFATPAMANNDLLQEVTTQGWDQYITNIVMPGEQALCHCCFDSLPMLRAAWGWWGSVELAPMLLRYIVVNLRLFLR
jgi:hypothetical protein